MTDAWSPADLRGFEAAVELEIAVPRPDGTLRAWTPIWVVTVGGEVFVRSWHRRDTGWFGAAVRSGRARVRVPGLETDVLIEDVGPEPAGLRVRIDAAYRSQYAGWPAPAVDPMRTDAAAATTLRLHRAPSEPTAD